MPEAYIVDAVRSPVGRRGGSLSQVHSADLGAHSIKALNGDPPSRSSDLLQQGNKCSPFLETMDISFGNK